MKKLRPRFERTLNFIIEFIGEHDYPPLVREIQRGLAISSTSVVTYHLYQLEEGGYITRETETARGIKVLNGTPRRIVVMFTGDEAELIHSVFGDDLREKLLKIAAEQSA